MMPIEEAGAFTSELYIGPCALRASSELPIYEAEIDHDLYLPFRSPGLEIPLKVTCKLELSLGVEKVSPGELIYEAENMWRVYKDSALCTITRSGGALGFDNPLYTFSSSDDFEHVDVLLSEKFSQEGPAGPGLRSPIRYPLDQMVLQQLFGRMQSLLMHAACVDFGSGAVLFAGVSGAGKTTFSRLIKEEGPVQILTDDRTLLVKTHSGWLAGGTPWPGEGRFALNEWRPLRHICFLEKGPENKRVAISNVEVLSRLLPLATIPWYDEERMGVLLGLVDELLTQVEASVFTFRPDESAFEFMRAASF